MSIVGGLQNYYTNSTNCYDRCGYFNTSKQERLGFDNRNCLIKCNDFYSYLKNNNLKSIPVTFERGYLQQINNEYMPYIRNTEDLKDVNLYHNIKQCQHQCDLDARFMSLNSLNECKRRCNEYTAIKMKY